MFPVLGPRFEAETELAFGCSYNASYRAFLLGSQFQHSIQTGHGPLHRSPHSLALLHSLHSLRSLRS